jgi:hypothetical protein
MDSVDLKELAEWLGRQNDLKIVDFDRPDESF